MYRVLRVKKENQMEEYMPRATSYLQQAVQADENEQYPEALDAYIKGMEWFMMARKYCGNNALRDRLNGRAAQYLDRMEEIKKILREAPPPSAPVAQAAPISHQKDGDSNELRRALEKTVMGDVPKERLVDVVGLEDAKRALSEAALMPIQAPQLWDEGERSWAGILLYGPPGTGKTFLAKAIAGESGCTFFSISASDLLSKWVGQSEGLIKTLFEMARENTPCIIFIDEVDSLLAERGSDTSSASADRVVAEMLTQMDGAGRDNTGILIMSATNNPWKLDSAAIRRAEKRVYIPLPDAAARRVMLERCVHSRLLSAEELDRLAADTEGYSGDDIRVLLKKVSMKPRGTVASAKHFRRADSEEGAYIPCNGECNPGGDGITHSDDTCLETDYVGFPDKKLLRLPPVTPDDFFAALQETRPSVDPATLRRYEEFTSRLGSV